VTQRPIRRTPHDNRTPSPDTARAESGHQRGAKPSRLRERSSQHVAPFRESPEKGGHAEQPAARKPTRRANTTAQHRFPGVRTGAASRLQLTLLSILAVANWSWLVAVVLTSDPDVTLNRAWFIVAITLAGFPTATLLMYAVRKPRVDAAAARACFGDSLREGFLISTWISANAALRMTTFWSPLTAALLLALAGIVDVIVLARRWAPPTDDL